MQGFCEWCNQEVPYGPDGSCYIGHPASALRKGTLTGTMQTIVEPPFGAPQSPVALAADDVTASAVDRDTSELLAATLASALAATDDTGDDASSDVETFVVAGADGVPGDDNDIDAGLEAELSTETVFGTAHPAGDDGVAFGVPDAVAPTGDTIGVEQWSVIPIPDTDIPVYEYRPPKRDFDDDVPSASALATELATELATTSVATVARPAVRLPAAPLETVPALPAFVTFGVDHPSVAAVGPMPTAPVAPARAAFAHDAHDAYDDDADNDAAPALARTGRHDLVGDERLRVLLAVLTVVMVVAAIAAAVSFA